MCNFQVLSSRHFQRGFDRFNLYRPTLCERMACSRSLPTTCPPPSVAGPPTNRGLHSFTLELNLSNSRTHSWVKLGHTVDRRVQVELKPERV
jgi:hypothetical protein